MVKCYLFLDTDKLGAMCCWFVSVSLLMNVFPAKLNSGQGFFK